MTYRPIRFLFALLAPTRLLIPLSIVALLAALVVGCATFKNTPQQDATRRHFDECLNEVRPMRAYLTRVDPNGTYAWNYGADDTKGRNDMMDCMYRKGHKRIS
jgi:hypothetical protein